MSKINLVGFIDNHGVYIECEYGSSYYKSCLSNKYRQVTCRPLEVSSDIIGKRVTVYNRYLFAVPVKGTIKSISPHDGSYQIVFDKDQHGGSNVNKHDLGYFFPQECVII